MKITKIDAARQLVSRWSGGTTTQLAICPAEAVYADHDFLWRISSAVVELPESDFTPLPDYDRILLILEGELSLSHDGGEEYTLRALEQTSFDGASQTFSRGQVTDFNLMMRKGRCAGRVEPRELREGETWQKDASNQYADALLFCVDGNAEIVCGDKTELLAKGEALLLEDAGAVVCRAACATATVILAEMGLK